MDNSMIASSSSRQRSQRLILAGLMILFSSCAASSQELPPLDLAGAKNDTELIEAVDKWLVELQKAGKFNGGVLIARDGKPQLMKTYGFADAKAERPLTVQTPFRLASVSKQFTAAGILRLAELKSLDLDQPVGEYLKGFPFKEVTVRHLLNQTSGIPDVYMELASTHRRKLGDILLIKHVPDLLRREQPKTKNAGDKYMYSNTDYVLLAAVIESITGTSFEQFMHKELFEPLGMKDSRVFNRVSKKPFPDRAEDYRQAPGIRAKLPMSWLDGVAGDGATFCSLRDFVKWNEFWNGKTDVVSQDLVTQAFVRPKLNNGTASSYGFGWALENGRGRAWHNGSWLGAQTYTMRDPTNKRYFVLLDNSKNKLLPQIAQSIRKVIFPWNVLKH